MANKPTKKRKLSVMVSSTVYGFEDLLDQLHALLTQFGYDVRMSHRGTIPVISNESAFETSLRAVEECDLFFGLVTPFYGSGVPKGDISITHQEFKRAIELNKPRWFLAHEYVVYARLLLRGLGYKNGEERSTIETFDGAGGLNDLRVIDMYDAATRNDVAFRDRTGNWVQKFYNESDALLFATSQFIRYQQIEQFVKQNLGDPSSVKAAVEARTNGQ